MFIILSSLSIFIASHSPELEFDRGKDSRDRNWKSAENCMSKPCTLTEHGAIRVSKEVSKKYKIEIGNLHRGSYRQISLFEESTSLEQKFTERIFNKRPNRKIVNLSRLIETGNTQTIFMYGILLQYEFDEGDLIALRLIPRKSAEDVIEFYFRYHQDALKFDVDIAFVQPINYFTPNPRNEIQAALSTAALSFSVARAIDPDDENNFLAKTLWAIRFNLFLGLLARTEVANYQGDKITKDYFDGFVGAGFSFFGFLAGGYGVNLARSPRAFFPFVGIEFVHLTEFLRSLKQDTHTRWQNYLKEEVSK